ncbi:MAG: ATP-grasp domain-containing protein [Myxococcota bacterium]
MTTHVLVTGAGGAAAVSFLRAVQGPGIRCFAVDIDPLAAGLYLVEETNRSLIPRGDDPAMVGALLALCERHQIDILVPTVDTELAPIAAQREAFEARGVRVMLSGLDALQVCADKWMLMNVAAAYVPIPETVLLDADFAVDDCELPVIAKPRRGAGGRGVRRIAGREDWAGLPRDGSYIVQRYLPGDEYSVDVLCDAKGTSVLAAVPRARMKVDSGVAVAGRTLHDVTLESTSRMLAAHLGLRYVINIQWKRDPDGVPRLLEINPRFPGTMPLTIAAGVDMPNLALQLIQGQEFSGPLPFRDVAVVRHWDERIIDVGAFERVPTATVQESAA